MHIELTKQTKSLELIKSIAIIANESVSAKEAITLALKNICLCIDWPIGHAFIKEIDEHQLVSSKLWYLKEESRFSEFQQVTESIVLNPGKGLPGSVYLEKRLLWIKDVEKSIKSPRARFKDDGLVVDGFAVPILVKNEVVMVLEFFTDDKQSKLDEGFISLMTDIAIQLSRIIEREQIEKHMNNYMNELENNSSFLQGILDNAIEGIISIDTKGTILSVNPAAGMLFGYEAKEIMGKNIKMLMPEPYHSEHDQYLKNYLNTGEKNIIGQGREAIGKRKDGSVFPVELAVGENKSKSKHFFTGIIRDISVVKNLQLSLQKKNEQLEHSNQELERFAYVASHDLQEPLRMISSYVQLLEKRYKAKLDQDARDYIAYVVDGTLRMQNLIRDLFKYSKLNSEARSFSSINANELFDDVIQNLKVIIEKTGSVVTKDKLPTIFGEANQLVQLFQNLIGNAVKYHDPKKKNKVHVSAKEDKNEWQFCIEDNGIGIAPEYYQNIFILFKRLHDDAEYEGTGIGLPICERIVKYHNGQIWVESEIGQGSRFYFTISKDGQNRNESV